ncbi:hypothetical protein ScPMuIL_016050 [Solemya velum]
MRLSLAGNSRIPYMEGVMKPPARAREKPKRKRPTIETRNTQKITGHSNSGNGNFTNERKAPRGKPEIMAGAPRDNDTNNGGFVRPGALYRCPFPYQGAGSCESVVVINTTTLDHLVSLVVNGTLRHYYHEMANQWLGVTLDVRQPSHADMLVCAHRWIDAKFVKHPPGGGQYHMLGLCYSLSTDFDKPGVPILALLNGNRLVDRNERFVIFSMGALGMDAMFTDDDDYIAMSAPGMNDWSGGIVFEKAGDFRFIEPERSQFVNAYVGYAITTGHFLLDKREYLVTGAPRMKETGAVYIFHMSSTGKWLKEIIGTEFGGYFGAALCAVDVDNDGMDDLLVGAPMVSTEYVEEGRVFVYLSKGLMIFEEQPVPLYGSKTESRFGTAIAQLGDINNDGFNDVAVGAPLEDEHRGAVYIYNGHTGGLWTQWSQRIFSGQINTGLRGFGSSFSRPFDIDENQYNDIAVGSYMSNQAVLLRTSPLINFSPSMVLLPEEFDRVSPSMSLKLCFTYSSLGGNVPGTMRFNFSLALDIGRGDRLQRVVVKEKEGEEHTSLEQQFSLQKDKQHCFEGFTLQVKILQDIVDDVELLLTYGISEDADMRPECDVCPVITVFDGQHTDRSRDLAINKIIPFAKDCGDDGKCNTDLKIKARIIQDSSLEYIIIDSSKYIILEAVVVNKGENAYKTILYVTVPRFFGFIRDKLISGQETVVCSWEDRTITPHNSTFACMLGNPLKENEIDTIHIQFSAPEEIDANSVGIQLHCNTSSTETELSDNTVVIDMPIKLKPTVNVSGISFPEQLIMNNSLIPNSPDAWKGVVHIYEVHNSGPNKLPNADVMLQIPILFRETRLVFKRDIEVTSLSDENSVVQCKQLLEGTGNTANGQSVPRRPNPTQGVTEDSGPSPLGQVGVYNLPSENVKDFTLNCSTIPCSLYRCPVANISKNEGLVFKVKLNIHKNIMSSLMVRDVLTISSILTLSFPNDSALVEEVKQQQTFQIHTAVYPFVKKGGGVTIEVWILAVSIVSGLLLMFIILIIMWKCNFFSRQKRDDLRKLMRSSNEVHAGNEQTGADNSGLSDGNMPIMGSENQTQVPSNVYPDLSDGTPLSENKD